MNALIGRRRSHHTRRNLEHYPSSCRRLVGIDGSSGMLRVAKEKASQPDFGPVQAEFHAMDAHQLQFPDESFDAVVDTFGLCSYDRPEQALGEMLRVCKSSGEVLLLEHGRSESLVLGPLINFYLDGKANRHAKSWGCWWNKSIHGVVESALKAEKRSTCVEHSTKHMGTTHRYKITFVDGDTTTTTTTTTTMDNGT